MDTDSFQTQAVWNQTTVAAVGDIYESEMV